MSSDPTKAADPARRSPQAPEAELPQAPPGAPEGHDAVLPDDARLQEQAQPDCETPGSELDELAARAQKADEYLALAQRTKADFENYRKRSVRDAAAAQERGAVKLALALLPAIDNLERALAHVDTAAADVDATGSGTGNGDASLVAGIKHVHSDVIAALGRAGIEPYSPEGEPFDPQFHEAVAQQPVEGTDPGVVVEVFQRGYRMGESVVRPARVVVAG
jgi:molecular chaperone GrpE